MPNLIELDGNHGEGGGAIVRTALALSAHTGKPFRVTNIRSGRSVPGLKAQHLSGIKILTDVCSATVEGAVIGSEAVEFIPREFKPKNIDYDIGTAGSVTLLLQSILLPYMMSGKSATLRLTGGTNVKWSPPVDYFTNIFLPMMNSIGHASVSMPKRGFYPKGGGEVIVKIKRKNIEELGNPELRPIIADKSVKPIAIKGVAYATLDLQGSNVCERMAQSARVIAMQSKVDVLIGTEYCQSLSTGTGICLWAITEQDTLPGETPALHGNIIHSRVGVDLLGERGTKAEDVGHNAGLLLNKLIAKRTPVDSHFADMIIPYMGLLPGSRILVPEITEHLKSNIYVTESLLNVKFKIEQKNGCFLISC
ncbi:RNA 3'-terminal phosphate cyclase [Candidatus Woesearchaeota archaeon]|nr:RNA 3'-terminal phosphate cyclase [Candidatus Woesearchaeota archaeon]